MTWPDSRAHHASIARRFSPNVTWLGLVSALTAMSSAMIYGLLPVFLVRVLRKDFSGRPSPTPHRTICGEPLLAAAVLLLPFVAKAVRLSK